MDTILDIDPKESTAIDTNSFDMIHSKQNSTDSIMVINFSKPEFLPKLSRYKSSVTILSAP